MQAAMTKTATTSVILLLCFFLVADVSHGIYSICRLPKVVGFCRARFPMFYYDTTTRKCEPFIYGGCEGNANRFGTLKACQERCMGFRAIIFH